MSAIHCTNTKGRKRQYHNNNLLATCCALLTVVLLLPVIAQARTYCGKLWNTVIEVDERYMFFPPNYEGVNIWAGEGHLNREKGCDDQFSTVAFYVDWPELTASPNGAQFALTPTKHNIAVVVSSGMNPEWQALLDRYLGRFEYSPTKEIPGSQRFDEQLGLNVIDVLYREERRRRVYWSTREDGSVGTIIECRLYEGRNRHLSSCELVLKLPQYRAKMEIRFLWSNIRQWKEMEEKSIQLLNSFIKHE